MTPAICSPILNVFMCNKLYFYISNCKMGWGMFLRDYYLLLLSRPPRLYILFLKMKNSDTHHKTYLDMWWRDANVEKKNYPVLGIGRKRLLVIIVIQSDQELHIHYIFIVFLFVQYKRKFEKMSFVSINSVVWRYTWG